MKKIGKIILGLLEIVIILYVIVMTAILMNKNKYGYTQFGKTTIASVSVKEERANKTLKEGDLLVVKGANDYSEGDFVYYYSVTGETYMIRSEKITRKTSDDFSSVYTIGDETSLTVIENRVLGKDIKIYHNLGKVLKILQSRVGFLFLVLLPILVIFIYQVYEFVILLKYEKTKKA